MDTFSYKENLIIDLGACSCKSGLSNEIIEKNKENNQSLEFYTLKSGYCEHESKMRKQQTLNFIQRKDLKDAEDHGHLNIL